MCLREQDFYLMVPGLTTLNLALTALFNVMYWEGTRIAREINSKIISLAAGVGSPTLQY